MPNDSRIAKVTIDGGPGTITRIYCLEGIWGIIQYKSVSGRASLRFRGSHPSDTALILCCNADFDGQFRLDHSAQQLILDVVPMNPAATVEIDHPNRNPDLPQNHITLSLTRIWRVFRVLRGQGGLGVGCFHYIGGVGAGDGVR